MIDQFLGLLVDYNSAKYARNCNKKKKKTIIYLYLPVIKAIIF